MEIASFELILSNRVERPGYVFSRNKFSLLVKMVSSRKNDESGTDVSESFSSQSIPNKAKDKNILNKLRSATSVNKETST